MTQTTRVRAHTFDKHTRPSLHGDKQTALKHSQIQVANLATQIKDGKLVDQALASKVAETKDLSLKLAASEQTRISLETGIMALQSDCAKAHKRLRKSTKRSNSSLHNAHAHIQACVHKHSHASCTDLPSHT